MDFRTLQYFTVVARELNFTRAAEKLNMTQPPLSHQIQDLEQDLGVQLFIRGKRRLQLTDAGRLLLRRAEQILSLADRSRTELAQLEDGLSGTLCLAMVEGQGPYYAAKWISAFREEFPKVTYELWNGSSDDVLDHLHRGLADLAIIAAPYDTEHLEGFSIGQAPWVAILNRSHPLAQLPGDEIPLSKLAGEPLIIPSRKSRVEAIQNWFSEIGAEPNILCTLSHRTNAVALVEQNVGVSVFVQPDNVSNDKVVTKIITQPAKRAEYLLVWSKAHKPSELVQEFILCVKDLLEEDRQSGRTGGQDFSVSEDAALL